MSIAKNTPCPRHGQIVMNENKQRNITEMNIGDIIVLEGAEARAIKFVRILETRPRKQIARNGQAVEPQPYAQMRYGQISFTINEEAALEIVSNKEKRDDIYSVTLEVTEFDQVATDDAGNEILDEQGNSVMVHRRGLAFVDLMTYESKKKLALRNVTEEGAIHAEKVKYGLPTANTTVDEVVAKAIAKLKAEPALAEA